MSGHVLQLKIAPSHGDMNAHLTRGSSDPRNSASQTASRSVLCTAHNRQSLNFTMASFPQKLPLPMGIWTLSNTLFLGPTRGPSPQPNGISIGSAVFAGLTSVTDWQTDRQTMLLGR